ncbi:MAG: cytochrome d ubiquinol oxidase subunit II [Candidatus Electrothrix sp. ATG2]|nr:cytochrome d ubiquinol oxidase subunit II [Candidatus Electrothrix sp. ATG2]
MNWIGTATLVQLQELWWLICSVLGSLLIFLFFVQGGQTLLAQLAKTDKEKSLLANSLGRKWELSFTTLVTFGGAMFAAFPKFYATSFGGAYWVWMLILFTFILQAVSYEYRSKPNNVLGTKVFDIFLFINGSVGVLLIGAAVGTFFTGSNFVLDRYNLMSWTHPLRGVEAAFSVFNLSLGIFLVFNSRVLGAMYLINNIDFKGVVGLERRLRDAVLKNFYFSLPFLACFLIMIFLIKGYAVNEAGEITLLSRKYLQNLIEVPALAGSLAVGLVLVIAGVLLTAKTTKKSGIWFAGFGSFLVGMTVFGLAGFNNTAFYPSKADLQSSLTIYNASSTLFTLQTMTWVALAIPFVLGYVAYVWRAMDGTKLSVEELANPEAGEMY